MKRHAKLENSREVTIYRATTCNDDSININEISATLSNTAFKISIPIITTDKITVHIFTNKGEEIIIEFEK